ncbi:MAG: hypothetical protein ACXVIJ_11085, partial [Thermoanaerobaculia bacterium]
RVALSRQSFHVPHTTVAENKFGRIESGSLGGFSARHELRLCFAHFLSGPVRYFLRNRCGKPQENAVANRLSKSCANRAENACKTRGTAVQNAVEFLLEISGEVAEIIVVEADGREALTR